MKSSYKRLGEFISPKSYLNEGMEVTELLGISNQKYFQKSHTNINGMDFSTYRIVRTGQFAFNRATTRNGEKISIALRQGNDCIVSPSYRVFQVNDEKKLLSEYLLMWFKRPEFDRYVRFKSHGSAHEFFEYDQMCDVELPVPSIEKQREIVKEYNVIQNRITLNQQLIQKLEETAQAIYKKWFVDFEFPNENGLPYKSNGGEMVESELGEIPKGWRVGTLDEIIDIIDGDRGANYPSQEEFTSTGYCLFLNAGNVSKNGFNFSTNNFIVKAKDKVLRKGKLSRYDIVLTTRGTVGNIGYYGEMIPFENIRINSGMVIMRSKESIETSIFVYSLLRSEYLKNTIDSFLSGSAQPQLPIRDIIRMPIIIPNNIIINGFGELGLKLQNNIDGVVIQNLKVNQFADLLLSKLATN